MFVLPLQEFVDFRINRNKMLRSRKNQILLAFSFWGEIEERKGPNIYELRSYVLKVCVRVRVCVRGCETGQGMEGTEHRIRGAFVFLRCVCVCARD